MGLRHRLDTDEGLAQAKAIIAAGSTGLVAHSPEAARILAGLQDEVRDERARERKAARKRQRQARKRSRR